MRSPNRLTSLTTRLPLERMPDKAAQAAAAKAAKERGTTLYGEKKYREAVDAFSEAIKSAPKDDEELATYHSNRAAALLQLNDAKRAKKDAQKCVDLRPLWPRGWSRLGAATEMLGDDAAAERAYEKLVSLAPDNMDARRSLSQVRARIAANPSGRGRRSGSGASSSFGWSMPSMPSMPSFSVGDIGATIGAVGGMARMRYARMTPNEQLVAKCVLAVVGFYVFKHVSRALGFGGYGGGYYDPYDDFGGGFSFTTIIGLAALYYAHKNGASIWNLLTIANMFGLTNGGGRRRRYGGYGGYGRPGGMFF